MATAWDHVRLAHLYRGLNKVNRLASGMRALSDEALRQETNRLKQALAKGRPLQALVPEAFAAMREAAYRVLGMYPYDVQVLCALALQEGNIAEMKTGEGKTLVAVLPLYAHALTGNSTILITANDYLARRDGAQMAPLFAFMGMTLAVGLAEPGGELTPAEKRAIYAADVVYTTHGVLGFDYLLHHLATDREGLFLRPFSYAILDEADAVLLDSAQTPLVIAGAPKVQSQLYASADLLVRSLKEGEDFETEDKKTWLTARGVQKAEVYYGLSNLYADGNFSYARHIYLALQAHLTLRRGKAYVVKEGRVQLLDGRAGRIVDHTKLRSGQHQAIEAKEGVPLTPDAQAVASITFQAFFNLFPEIAGMSGTAKDDADELRAVYGLSVAAIPTRLPCRRKDLRDAYFYGAEEQIAAAAEEAAACHKRGQPVLMITGDMAMAAACSRALLARGVAHQVLDAHSAAREAEMIREAGQKGAVTVATPIAGRGTDIHLGEGVAALGGLAVLGVGRMENRRLERQARGRAGRQGDPGVSRFFVALSDEVAQSCGPARWREERREQAQQENRQRDKHRRRGPIRSPLVRFAFDNAQRVSESRAREARRQTLLFDESSRMQREAIYALRDSLLSRQWDDRTAERWVRQAVEQAVCDAAQPPTALWAARFVRENIDYAGAAEHLPVAPPGEECAALSAYLQQKAAAKLAAKQALLSERGLWETYCRRMLLSAVDSCWVDEVDALQELRLCVAGRSAAQRQADWEYHKEAFAAWQALLSRMTSEGSRNLLLGEVRFLEGGSMQIILP